jgi:hypothetical protein
MIERRGGVVSPDDLHHQWIEWLQVSGLNVFGFHVFQSHDSTDNLNNLIKFVASKAGRSFTAKLRQLGIDVEYELHVMSWLLPRAEFRKHPEWFRMDVNGNRQPFGNFCPSNAEALDIVASNASKLAERLTPTTNHYYFWPDDTPSWCLCQKCRKLSPSDQNLVAMNAILSGLQKQNPNAILAYLAYKDTLNLPSKIHPLEGIFLEFAPIHRVFDRPLRDRNVPANLKHAVKLKSLIKFFGTKNAQILEYWLDASLFAKWRKPAKRLLFSREVIMDDIQFYAELGFQSITSFALWLDTEYIDRYGTPPIVDYGAALRSYSEKSSE